MKKFIVFIVSFSMVYMVLQLLSGLLLTELYTPEPAEAWQQSHHVQQEIVMTVSYSPYVTFFIALLSAFIAYLIPNRFMNKNN